MTNTHEQPHYRKLIRNRAKQLLRDPDTGIKMNSSQVYCSRPLPVFLTELPVCLIYFTEEGADHKSSAPRYYERELTLVTEVLHNIETERENALDDYLDSRAFEIERALTTDKFLGLEGIVQDCVLTRTEVINLNFEGERTAASLRIFWNVKYVTQHGFVGALDEFLKFNAKYNLGIGAEAEDMVTIRTE